MDREGARNGVKTRNRDDRIADAADAEYDQVGLSFAHVRAASLLNPKR